ncbi:hypothetical protein ARNL5_03407 [Anaerolineae bacterium]|nr:hypothetical protein ARNL5_03407 [Anaerolineae bacterium]
MRFMLKLLLAALVFIGAFKGAEATETVIRAIIPTGESAPKGWKVKEWKGKADINVVKTQFGNAVHLRSSNTSSAIYREMDFDLKEFPNLNWRWKVTKIPRGADVRNKKADDQAAQVYVIFPRWPEQVNSRLVGYIWDSSAPAGLTLHSTKSKNTRYVVIRSGQTGLGDWLQEKRNVYEDYKALFKEEPPRAASISIMIDSDDTDSSAEAFVGDIYFSR